MKRWFALALVAVLTVLLVATAVSAQAPQPQPTPQPYGPGNGRGMMNGQGGGMMRAGVDGDEGLLHDGMVAALAAKLGLKVEDIEARLDKGETMWQIAQSKEMTVAQYQTWMLEARTSAIDAAVKAGTLTQAQADWMKQRNQNMPMFQENFDPANCPMNAQQNGTTARGGRGMGGGMGGGMMGRGR
jgi:opacity protein-like surface antigen